MQFSQNYSDVGKRKKGEAKQVISYDIPTLPGEKKSMHFNSDACVPFNLSPYIQMSAAHSQLLIVLLMWRQLGMTGGRKKDSLNLSLG